MGTWLWGIVLVAALWAAHWGAERLTKPLEKLRRRWEISVAAGGAFVGLTAASPEIGINTASAIRGVADIGLGVMLGSNILAIPLVVSVVSPASRSRFRGDSAEAGETPTAHPQHRRQGVLRVEQQVVTVQALPYLGIVAAVALLILPAPWRGLQPIDGWIMLAIYAVFLAQAVIRGRHEDEGVSWSKKELGLAFAGVAAIALGTFFAVRATENITTALGISRIVGGLFVTAPVAVMPELFAVRSVTRSGQVTAATASVIGDHAVTLTVAFLPLALVGWRCRTCGCSASTSPSWHWSRRSTPPSSTRAGRTGSGCGRC